MCPSFRALRAPPLPRLSRRLPLNEITAMELSFSKTTASRRPWVLGSDEQRAQRALLVNALHGITQQAGDGELDHVLGKRRIRMVERVGHYQLDDGRALHALERV